MPDKNLSFPRILLHAEGAVVFLAAMSLFHYMKGSWLVFIIAFIAVDVFMAGYLVSPKVGSITYNAGHVYIAPLIIAAWRLYSVHSLLLQASTAWIAHIGIDRAFGYGLKYPEKFKDGHLKRV